MKKIYVVKNPKKEFFRFVSNCKFYSGSCYVDLKRCKECFDNKKFLNECPPKKTR